MLLLDTFFPSAVAGAAGVAGLLAVSPAICANARPGANVKKVTEGLRAGITQSAATRNLMNLLLEIFMVVPSLVWAENIIGSKRR
jgi:hypothetical protein